MRGEIEKLYNEGLEDSKNEGKGYKEQYREAVKKVLGGSKKSGIGFYISEDKSERDFKKIN